MTGYAYIKINGQWLHLQNLAWDTSRVCNVNYALNILAAVRYLSGGQISSIEAVTDIRPNADGGPARPGWLLPYVDSDRYTPKELGSTLRHLEKLGFELPKRPVKAFLAGVSRI